MVNINYKIVRYNNKSRKGTYLRITSKIKGKTKTGTYKFGFQPLEIDALKNYYTDKYIKKQKVKSALKYKKTYTKTFAGKKHKKRERVTRQAEQYLSQIKKKKTIFQEMKAGITQADIQDVMNATQTTLNKAKEKTLRPLVADKQARNIMTQKTNYDKLQTRLEYRFEARDKKGNMVLQAKTAIKTPEKALEQFKKIVEEHNQGQYYRPSGWNLQIQGKAGKDMITKTNMKIIIRKAQTTL